VTRPRPRLAQFLVQEGAADDNFPAAAQPDNWQYSASRIASATGGSGAIRLLAATTDGTLLHIPQNMDAADTGCVPLAPVPLSTQAGFNGPARRRGTAHGRRC